MKKLYLFFVFTFLLSASIIAQWAYTDDLNSGRQFTRGTILQDGSIFVCGGVPGTGNCGASQALNNAEIFDSATELWSLANGVMNNQRFKHTVTLLNTGNVLIAGGVSSSYSGSTIYDNAEVYLTSEDNFITVSNSMTDQRSTAASIKLADGKVLICGGDMPSGKSNTADIYDPVTNTFTQTGLMNFARSGHTANLLNDGTVLITGGANTLSVEIYDPQNGLFTEIPNALNTKRSAHTATSFSGGKVAIIGGYDYAGAFLNSIEIFDPATQQFNLCQTSMETVRHRHSSTLLPDGRIIISGGFYQNELASTEIFNPLTDEIVNFGALNDARFDHKIFALEDGRIITVSGAYNCSYGGSLAYSTCEKKSIPVNTAFTWKSGVPFIESKRTVFAASINDDIYIAAGSDTLGNYNYKSFEKFNINSMSWMVLPQMPEGRAGNGGMIDCNGKIYMLGGEGPYGGNWSKKVYEYDPSGNTWNVKNEWNSPKRDFGYASLGNKIYVAGGQAGYYDISSEFKEYDPINDSWTSKTDLPIPMTACLLANVDNELFLIGGRTGITPETWNNQLWKYNFSSDQWDEMGNMPEIRKWESSAENSGSLFLIGGYSSSGDYNHNVWKYSVNSQAWEIIPSQNLIMTTGHSFHSPVVDGKLYFFGSQEFGNNFFDNYVQYAELETIPNTGFSVDLVVADAGGRTGQTIKFGTDISATDGLDLHLGELELPPVPPAGIFDVRLIFPDGITASLTDYRYSEQDEITWQINFQEGADGFPVTVSWDQSDIPQNGSFIIEDPLGGSIVHTNMRFESNVTITNNALTNLLIKYTKSISSEFSTLAGWNLLSVPVQAEDMSVNAIFPLASSSAYAFDNGYVTVDNMENGKGYWLKFDTTFVHCITGLPVTYNVSVNEGWNMIGFFDQIVPTNQIVSNPANIISSEIYGFSGAYNITDELIPGHGYWIKCSQAGELSFNSSAAKFASTGFDQSEYASIKITDANGNSNKLFMSTSSISGQNIELPPLPPAGIFDVRFAGNNIIENISSGKEIYIRGAKYPVTLSANGIDIVVNDANSEKLANTVVKDGNSFQISDSKICALKIATADIPLVCTLAQNYPNPFNPETTISFGIPESGKVNLSIYDILGRKVAELVNENLPAGNYNHRFNAANFASGVYFYRITVNDFSAVKKFVLMK